MARTTSVPAWRAQRPRTVSRSSSCSGEKSRSMALLRLPALAAPGPGVVVGGGGQGDAGGALGGHAVLHREGDVDFGPAAAGVVGLHLRYHAPEDHRVAGEHRSLHAEPHAADAALRTRPVGQVALEPGRLV